MGNLKIAFRNVFIGKRNQLGKIIFLGAGLAAGLMLVTKVWFEFNYEDFYPGADRIYLVQYTYSSTEDGDIKTAGSTPGGIGPYLQDRIPMVETATRYTPLVWGRVPFYTGNGQKLHGQFFLADSNFPDVLPRPMIVGDAREILSTPMTAMVSRSIADAMDGDPVGQTIENGFYPGKSFTVTGVFEDVPENTLYRYDILVSMESIGEFTYDGRERLLGNDRYTSFIKVYPGTDPKELQEALDREALRIDDFELARENGKEMGIVVSRLSRIHTENPEIRRMTLILLILAMAIIFTTVFNYLLVVLSDTVNRGREIGVIKCYGAGFRDIAAKVLGETFLQLAVLLAVAVLLILLFRSTAETILGTSLASLLTWKSGAVVFGIMLAILAVSTYVQARVYNNIPVASVFRRYKGSGRRMKLSLLFVQIIAAAFLTLLLVTVIRQYDAMVNDDPGYDYRDKLIVTVNGAEGSRMAALAWELDRLPGVESVARASDLPHGGLSGNNVTLPDDNRELFNIADLYYVDENFIPMLGIPVIEGRNFARNFSRPGDAMVSRKFAERLLNFTDWPDGVVGKEINITEHGIVTVTGVYEDIKLGSGASVDDRPTVVFYSDELPRTVLVKMRDMGYDNINAVTRSIESFFPGKDVNVSVYADQIVGQYQGHLLFRKSITIASVIVVIIVLVGLFGYAKDEAARREKEIAVRKINGATVGQVLELMSVDVIKLTVPALIAGVAVAYYVGRRWMEEFPVKVSMHWWISVGCSLLLAAVIIAAVTFSALAIARRNPAESLKNE